MQKAMEGESVQKFLLYSGHDSTRMLLVFIVIITIVICCLVDFSCFLILQVEEKSTKFLERYREKYQKI